MVPVSFFLLSQPRPPVQLLLQSLSLSATNSRWSERMKAEDPAYFDRLKNQQAPKYLWIGCADSRVPVSWRWRASWFFRATASERARVVGGLFSFFFRFRPWGFLLSLLLLFLFLFSSRLHSLCLSLSLNHSNSIKTNRPGQPNPRPSPWRGLCPGEREKEKEESKKRKSRSRSSLAHPRFFFKKKKKPFFLLSQNSSSATSATSPSTAI